MSKRRELRQEKKAAKRAALKIHAWHSSQEELKDRLKEVVGRKAWKWYASFLGGALLAFLGIVPCGLITIAGIAGIATAESGAVGVFIGGAIATLVSALGAAATMHAHKEIDEIYQVYSKELRRRGVKDVDIIKDAENIKEDKVEPVSAEQVEEMRKKLLEQTRAAIEKSKGAKQPQETNIEDGKQM